MSSLPSDKFGIATPRSGAAVCDSDCADAQHLHSRMTRQQRCGRRMVQVLGVSYVSMAIAITFLCIHYLASYDPAVTNNDADHVAKQSVAPFFQVDLQANCVNGWYTCGQGCCPPDYTCNGNYCSPPSGGGGGGSGSGSGSGGVSSDDANKVVVIVVTVLICLWFGPLICYGLIIAIIRCTQSSEFDPLRNSSHFQSWVIISGCFDMSIESSSGDVEFNQAAHSLVNVYGGCGDECLLHCVGCWFCGACYPFCMCCVTASRNQSKVGRLQWGLSSRGYTAQAQFLSSAVPACCNSIFIGLLQRNQVQPAVVIPLNNNINNNNNNTQNNPYFAASGYVHAGQSRGGYAQFQPEPQYVQPQYAPPQYAQPFYPPPPQYSAPQYQYPHPAYAPQPQVQPQHQEQPHAQPHAQTQAQPYPNYFYAAPPPDDQPPEGQKPLIAGGV